MAIRFDNAGEYSGVSASLPNYDPVTICKWVMIVTDRNNYSNFFQLTNAGASTYSIVGTDSNGTTLRCQTQNGTTTGTNLSTGTWYHIAYTRSGATHTVYLNGVSDISRSDNNAVTMEAFVLGGLSNWLNGRVARCKMWNAALSQAEIQQEMYTIRPVRFADLYAWWPMFPGATVRLEDSSGNGNTLIEGGTLSDEDDPPISYG
jgi:hypothetical protein